MINKKIIVAILVLFCLANFSSPTSVNSSFTLFGCFALGCSAGITKGRHHNYVQSLLVVSALAIALGLLNYVHFFSSTATLIASTCTASAIMGAVAGRAWCAPNRVELTLNWAAPLAALTGSLSATTVYFSGRPVLDPSFIGACVAACGFAAAVALFSALFHKRELNSAQLAYRFALGGAGALIAATMIPFASLTSMHSQNTISMLRLAIIASIFPSAYLFTLNNRGPFRPLTLAGAAAGVLIGTVATPFTFSLHIWIILIAAGALALPPNRGALQRSIGCCIAAVALISAPNSNTFRLIGVDTGWSETALTVGAVSFARGGSQSTSTIIELVEVMERSERRHTSISSAGTSAVFFGGNQELVTILDGFVHQSNSRESDAVRLTPHLGTALTSTPIADQRALVLGDPIGLATEGLITQGYNDVSVAVPNPASYRALAALSPAFEATMLHPSVQLLPYSNHTILRSAKGFDLIIDSASTPWHDSFQGIPTPSQLSGRSRSLSDSGVYIIAFDLGWLRASQLSALLNSFQGAFNHSWIFLPPNGGDHMIVASWNSENQIQWDSFVAATMRGESTLRRLDINTPIDLADRAVVKISDDILSAITPKRPTTLSIAQIDQRPQMLWPIFRPDFVSPAELFQENIDSALTDLLDARLDSNLAFLRLLESTSSGDMAELFEASRALQSTAVGERALDPLITPYLSRARSLIEQAAQEGPTSQLWGEAQGELAAALLLHPNTVDGAILSAEVSLGVGQTNAANSSFNRALQLAPDNAAAALGVARVAMLRRDLPRAERVLQRARDYHPLNWLIAYNLGVILKEKGDSTRAEELLREAAGLSDDSEASPHTALAELYLSTGEPTRALVEASRAMALSPSALNLYLQGKSYYEVEQYEQAEMAFQQAVLGDSHLWQARAGLGLIYALRADYTRCVSAFTDVLLADPNNPMALENRSRCTEAID